MVGTWTPPGAIFTFAFDDEQLTLELVKRTPIPEEEPISWMTFDVKYSYAKAPASLNFCLAIVAIQILTHGTAQQTEHIWRRHEEMVKLRRRVPHNHHSPGFAPNASRTYVSMQNQTPLPSCASSITS
jgi:hypothetical protein